jgi:hypothetical protein
MALTKVTSAGLTDDSIVNADINSSAAVALSKLATDPSNASNLASGTVPTARLGSGSASSSVFLAGDSSWIAAGGGKIGQVVSQATDSTSVTTSSTSFVTTGLTVTVPSLAATSSKVFITVNSPLCYEDNSPNSYCYVTIYADIDSAGDVDLGFGTGGFSGHYEHGIAYDDLGWNVGLNFLHSPSTVADVVYTVMFRTNNASASYVWGIAGKSVITCMEVLA